MRYTINHPANSCGHEFGTVLRIIRQEKRMNLRRFSLLSDYSVAHLSRIERNEMLLQHLHIVTHLANALKCSEVQRSELYQAYWYSIAKSYGCYRILPFCKACRAG